MIKQYTLTKQVIENKQTAGVTMYHKISKFLKSNKFQIECQVQFLKPGIKETIDLIAVNKERGLLYIVEIKSSNKYIEAGIRQLTNYRKILQSGDGHLLTSLFSCHPADYQIQYYLCLPNISKEEDELLASANLHGWAVS